MSANTNTTVPTTTTTTTSTSGGGNAGSHAGESLKGIFAKGHGIGETLRGNINSAIDGFTGDSAAQAKNEAVSRGGESEIRNGEFVKKGTLDKAL